MATVNTHEVVHQILDNSRDLDDDALIEQLRGLDLEDRDDEDRTVLARYVRYKYDTVVRLLLWAGADPQAAVLDALVCNNAGAYALLVARGARFTHDDFLAACDTLTPEDACKLLRSVFEFGAFDVSERCGGKPLLHALLPFLELPLSVDLPAGLSSIVNDCDAEGETAAVLAARTNNHAALTILLMIGASPSIRNLAGQNVLSFPEVACHALSNLVELGAGAAVVALVEAGVSVAAAQEYDRGLVHRCPSGDSTILGYLAAHGADLNRVGGYRTTPLQDCALLKHTSQMLHLIRLGADVNIVNEEGTALSIALEAASKWFPKSMPKTCLFSPCVVVLLLHGADPLARDADGRLYVADTLGTDEEEIMRLVNFCCVRKC